MLAITNLPLFLSPLFFSFLQNLIMKALDGGEERIHLMRMAGSFMVNVY